MMSHAFFRHHMGFVAASGSSDTLSWEQLWQIDKAIIIIYIVVTVGKVCRVKVKFRQQSAYKQVKTGDIVMRMKLELRKIKGEMSSGETAPTPSGLIECCCVSALLKLLRWPGGSDCLPIFFLSFTPTGFLLSRFDITLHSVPYLTDYSAQSHTGTECPWAASIVKELFTVNHKQMQQHMRDANVREDLKYKVEGDW